jgi:hypothetical protein
MDKGIVLQTDRQTHTHICVCICTLIYILYISTFLYPFFCQWAINTSWHIGQLKKGDTGICDNMNKPIRHYASEISLAQKNKYPIISFIDRT